MRQSALSVTLGILLIHQFTSCIMSSDSFEIGGEGERTPGVEPMSDDSSFEIGGGIPPSPGLTSDDETDNEIELGGGARADHRKRPRNRGPAPQQFAGSFWSVLVQQTAEGGRQIFGVAQLEWAFWNPDYARRQANDAGFLTYNARPETTFLLVDPVALGEAVDIQRPTALLVALKVCGNSLIDSHDDAAATVNLRLFQHGAKCSLVLLCSSAEVALFKAPGVAPTTCVRSVKVPARAKAQNVVPGFPSRKQFKSWRRDVQARYRDLPELSVEERPRTDTDPLTYLPPSANTEDLNAARPAGYHRWFRKEIDPVKLVHAMSIASKLRDVRFFEEIVDDCDEYLSLDSPAAPVERIRADPKRASIQRSLARADIVACLITRRQFKQCRLEDLIKSIHIFSDASPVVGVEMQGNILEIVFKDGSVLQLVLPGSTLAYGHTGTWDKGVVLVWGLWLVAGPEEGALAYVCSKVRSLTTDFGVEVHLLEMPDIVKAFMASISGRPHHLLQPLIDTQSRLFPHALRIAGWSHALGNIMKEVAESSVEWPKYISYMRALIRFFKNTSYRDHIAACFPDYPEIAALMKSFRASFAKWRYETVVTTFSELGKVRDLCENKLNAAMFTFAQDQTLIGTVMEACKDRGFWRWMAVSHTKAFRRLEVLRKWGMVCPCDDCNAERRRSNYKKHVKCPRTRLSRRQYIVNLLNSSFLPCRSPQFNIIHHPLKNPLIQLQ